jgi:hypothetical protein
MTIVNKTDAVNLLVREGWTKADANRALANIDFQKEPDELVIRRVSSQFAGQELYQRQRLQAAQKGMVTKKKKENQELQLRIDQLSATQSQDQTPQNSKPNPDLQKQIDLLTSRNSQLLKVNEELQKDNKALKTYVDQIRLKLAFDMRQFLRVEDSEIRRELIKWFSRNQG